MIKSFLGLFSDHQSKPIQPSGNVIRYQDIPEHSKLGLIHESYPQVVGVPIAPRPPEFFCQRYADELHDFFNRLALNKKEVDWLLMPLITRVMTLVNILPASESHHHSGVCGLFVHSVQCASAAVAAAERQLLTERTTLRQRYQDRPRWLLAAGVMGLVHDVGKVFDVEVIAENGDKWNPFAVSLWEWVTQAKAKQVFVLWRQNRVHKQHELRSVRVAYGQLFTNDLMAYLTEVSGDLIPGAIDDAIALGTGPLAAVLKEAEEESIRQDGESRRQLGSAYTRSASPLVTPILSAMKGLLEAGLWSVNKENSQVYVTSLGTFIRLNEVSASDVHQAAIKLQAPYVPGTPEGLIRVLGEQHLIDTHLGDNGQPSYVWLVKVGVENNRKQACIKLCDPMVLFEHNKLPAPIDVTICNANETVKKDAAASVTQKSKLRFMAPQTEYLQESNSRENKRASQQVTQAECDEIPQEAMKPQEAKVFVERLLATAVEQMRAGKGFLVENLVLHEDGRRTCSSQKVETVLEMHKIGQKTQEMLLRLISTSFRLDFDPSDHSFTFVGDDANEESKSGLSTGP